jgi:hypothetical protein
VTKKGIKGSATDQSPRKIDYKQSTKLTKKGTHTALTDLIYHHNKTYQGVSQLENSIKFTSPANADQYGLSAKMATPVKK